MLIHRILPCDESSKAKDSTICELLVIKLINTLAPHDQWTQHYILLSRQDRNRNEYPLQSQANSLKSKDGKLSPNVFPHRESDGHDAPGNGGRAIHSGATSCAHGCRTRLPTHAAHAPAAPPTVSPTAPSPAADTAAVPTSHASSGPRSCRRGAEH